MTGQAGGTGTEGPPPFYGMPPGQYPYPPPWWYPPPNPPKGWRLGLPPAGPGSLAPPARRLAARLLDGLLFLPVVALVVGVVLLIATPHFGPFFPQAPACSAATPAEQCPTVNTVPGFLWLELTVFACALGAGLLYVVVDAAITARWRRTPGKAIVGIRALHLADRRPLTFWRALARAAVVWLAGFLGWLGLLDGLWCLWDDNSQCVHDKVADTVVVSDT